MPRRGRGGKEGAPGRPPRSSGQQGRTGRGGGGLQARVPPPLPPPRRLAREAEEPPAAGSPERWLWGTFAPRPPSPAPPKIPLLKEPRGPARLKPVAAPWQEEPLTLPETHTRGEAAAERSRSANRRLRNSGPAAERPIPAPLLWCAGWGGAGARRGAGWGGGAGYKGRGGGRRGGVAARAGDGTVRGGAADGGARAQRWREERVRELEPAAGTGPGPRAWLGLRLRR